MTQPIHGDGNHSIFPFQYHFIQKGVDVGIVFQHSGLVRGLVGQSHGKTVVEVIHVELMAGGVALKQPAYVLVFLWLLSFADGTGV